MKKLKLEIDELAVESFVAGDGAVERGTVEARGDDASLGTVACVKETLATRMTCCPCTPAFLT